MRQDEFLSGLDLDTLHFAHTYRAAAAKYPMRNRGRYHSGFLYTISGTETYHFDGLTIDAVPGSVVYIPKGERYQITFHGTESVVIAIDFELKTPPIRPFRVDFSEVNAVHGYFSDLQARWERKEVGYLPACKAQFYKIVSAMLQQSVSAAPKKKQGFDDAVAYLKAHYLENDFRVDDLAEIADVTRRHFETLFKKRYRISPKEYILSMKIERAKELLLSERFLVKEIALLLGYSDVYHFGKLFKEKTGYTPREYKQAHGL